MYIFCVHETTKKKYIYIKIEKLRFRDKRALLLPSYYISEVFFYFVSGKWQQNYKE